MEVSSEYHFFVKTMFWGIASGAAFVLLIQTFFARKVCHVFRQ